MGLLSFLTGKKPATPSQDETPEKLTDEIQLTLQFSDYAELMVQLRDYMDKLHNILPLIDKEPEDQHMTRQDTLIRLAVYSIHESKDPMRLVNNEDVEQIFRDIARELTRMNRDPQAMRWAKLAVASKPPKEAAL